MSTPSIQTLITQAQQVLNLKSSNEIRATLAAVLANANVGTPLNPNLTTQQLWDEFYEIVRQPSDDIMSIITDQMMRMVFSPPAPGGAGADKQVIFNDGGVLAGDAGLVYNKTTDALTVAGLVTAGSATITGDLTVRTDKLAVRSNGVGIGTTSPTSYSGYTTLAILGGANGGVIDINTSGGVTAGGMQIASTATSTIFDVSGPSGGAAASILFRTGAYGVLGERYRIDGTGQSTWSVGGTTAMTLNSTGLGIGVAPVTGAKLAVAGPIVRNKGTVSATISVATTVATLPGEGLYIAYAYTNASNPTAFTSYAVILCDSVGSRVIANNGTQITITTSTFALQVTQIFTATMSVNWSFVQIG